MKPCISVHELRKAAVFSSVIMYFSDVLLVEERIVSTHKGTINKQQRSYHIT